jgi:uncharacterized protein
MSKHRFCRYELRTTDVDGAREFYASVVGGAFWDADVSVVPLPVRAAAMGAVSHWVGHIEADDVDGTMIRIAAQGGQQFGPTQRGADGAMSASFRDPFGARLALSSVAPPTRRDVVAWHMHHSRDHDRTFAMYSTLFGWTATEALDLGPHGLHQMFTWDASGRSVGSMANTARLPHVHPQWLFFFHVPDLDDALARALSYGAHMLTPSRTATGDIVVPGDDPQGAAFALYQYGSRHGRPSRTS